MAEPARTVLVVDDDSQMLRLVQKMLHSRNFIIQVAPKPSDALRIAETQPVDLLISDIALPEMDGKKLSERILKLHPGAAVLLVSGQYDENSRMVKSARVKFLSKPFFPSDLLRALDELFPGP
ncbi:MAG TPA: response regulator [Bryobacteraceae bacterium]|nr:response regulator [Bryobacteraceae bacterium]